MGNESAMKNIPFIDLQAQKARVADQIENSIKTVLAHGKFIMGPEVFELEKQLGQFSDAKHVVSCSSGTDALLLPLMAWEIGPGDAVFVPSFTFASTAEMVALLGATPIFVDVLPDTFNVNPAELTAAIERISQDGQLTPKAVIAVDLFGQIADYLALKPIAGKYNLKLIADAAQGYGSTLGGRQAGDWADAVTTSFFPAKPLGCYGDGGAVLTNDEALANTMESLRIHGKGTDKYDNVRIGINGRLDTMQAGILIEKLAIYQDEIIKRNQVASRYNEGLKQNYNTPHVLDDVVSTWAQYTLIVDDRDNLQQNLKEQGIPTAVYYPKPLHQQTAYKKYSDFQGALPVTEKLANKVVSLPMHPYLEESVQDFIIDKLNGLV